MERSAIQLLQKRGKSQREIARELGVSRGAVARAIREPVDRQPAPRQRSSMVDPYRPQIAQWLAEGLTAVRMLERVRADPERPYHGGRSVFTAAVHQIKQQQHRDDADVPVRFEGLPGEYLQVDWGEVRRFPFTRHPPVTRYFLVCRLKYSRWSWVRFTSTMRQETLFRGLIDCFAALGWVPWVLVFDNMKTVTTGRDAAGEAVWHPALLQLARECGFHPEACAVAAGNQKGSVESLVKWVKGNFLIGRSFADDADLAEQSDGWADAANTRPSSATGVAPAIRVRDEAVKGGRLPATAHDYGFPHLAQVSRESLVPVAGNRYSLPLGHVGAPVTVRVHRDTVTIWRDTTLLVSHRRAPDGAHERVVDLGHFAPLFAAKPRAQVMLYRQALLDLGAVASAYLSEVSCRRRDRLREEVLGTYTLFELHGAQRLQDAMAHAAQRDAYGLEYLTALLTAPPLPSAPPPRLWLPGIPAQAAIDRPLSEYEAWVHGAPPLDEQRIVGAPA